MDTGARRVRSDPTALAGAPAAALHELLDEVEAAFDHRPWPLFVDVPSDVPVQVIGDSHGDWPAVSAALEFARRRSPTGRLVALGDYIDRATRAQPDPAALPSGSVWNAAYVLAWAAADPEHVIPLRGNHEATRQILVPGPTLLRELRRAYPARDALPLWRRITELLERLPLAARTANGVVFTHGGIPPAGRHDPKSWRADDLELLEGLLWSDPDVEYEDRAVGFAYSGADLDDFLRSVGCRVMVKGHAPGHAGRAIYDGRLLTVHTSDLFASFGEGGIQMVEVPPRPRIGSAADLTLRVWSGSEWRVRPIAGVEVRSGGDARASPGTPGRPASASAEGPGP